MSTQAPAIADSTPLSEIVASPPTLAALAKAGFEVLGDVRREGIAAVQRVRLVGPGAVEALKEAMEFEVPPPKEEPPKKAPSSPAPASSVQAVEPAPRKVEPKPKKATGHHEVQESMLPLRLHSRSPGFIITWSRAHRVHAPGGGHQVQETLWIEFAEGKAKVTPRLYWTRHLVRNEVEIEKALAESRPWRVKCAEEIRGITGYGRDFYILPD